jgi:aminocarboxymuconate-semialdehyde decarboxylase
VNFDPAALRLAIQFAGVSQLLAGSDYPHMIGSIGRMKSSLDAVGLNEPDRSAILSDNATKLFVVI